MVRNSKIWIGACSLFGILPFGCAVLAPLDPDSGAAPIPQSAQSAATATGADPLKERPQAASLQPVVYSQPINAQPPGDAPFRAMAELSAEVLVEQVIARNPSLAQMIATWQAASARYPQVTSLEDLMFGATIGPETFHPDDAGVEFASRWEISQKYPWPGKLRLRGANSLAEASAASNDVEDMRLQLAESAKAALADYYLVARALTVNEETLDRLRQFRAAAEALFRTPPKDRKVSLQEVYQTDVEIGKQEERRLTLERMRQVAVARINTLLDLPPNAPLPPAPKKIDVESAPADPENLRSTALARRPDLRALSDRIVAEQAALALAYKEFCPDFEAFFMYDRFMGNTSSNRDLATMLGVKVNVPVRLERRRGAVAEAQARIGQRTAELRHQIDQVNFQVEEAYAQVRESERAVRLYEKKVLPDAELNVKTARADYTTGQVTAIAVIEAERSRLNLYDRYYEIIADYYRRRARLERVVGGSLAPVPDGQAADASKQPSGKMLPR